MSNHSQEERKDVSKATGPSEAFSITTLIVSLLGFIVSPVLFLVRLIVSGQLITEAKDSSKEPNGMVVAARLVAVIGIVIFLILFIAGWFLTTNIDFAGVSINFSEE